MNTIFAIFCMIVVVAMAVFAAKTLYHSATSGGYDSYPGRIMAAENDGELLEESNENHEMTIPDNID